MPTSEDDRKRADRVHNPALRDAMHQRAHETSPTSSEGRGTRTTCPTCGEPVIVYNDENGPHVESLAVAEIERLREALERIDQIECLHLSWERMPPLGKAVVSIRLEGPNDRLDREVQVDQTFHLIARAALGDEKDS